MDKELEGPPCPSLALRTAPGPPRRCVEEAGGMMQAETVQGRGETYFEIYCIFVS